MLYNTLAALLAASAISALPVKSLSDNVTVTPPVTASNGLIPMLNQPLSYSDWMGKYAGTKALKDLSLLASHDTACYTTVSNVHDLVVMVKAQNLNTYDQLRAGARVMNLRTFPFLDGGNVEYYHYHGEALGTPNRCATASETSSDIKKFFDEGHKEVLVVTLSHWYDVCKDNPFVDSNTCKELNTKWAQGYVDKVSKDWNDYLIKKDLTKAVNPTTIPVSTLTANGKGKIMIVNCIGVDGVVNPDGVYTCNDFGVGGDYSDRFYYYEVANDQKMWYQQFGVPGSTKPANHNNMFSIAWQATPDGSWSGLQGIEALAHPLNQQFPRFVQDIVKSPMEKNSAGYMINLFWVDFIGNPSYRFMETLLWYNGNLELDPKATPYPTQLNQICPQDKWKSTKDNSSPARRVLVELENRGNRPLWLIGDRVDSGEVAFCPTGSGGSFDDTLLARPCDVIYPGQKCMFGTESLGVMTGTEGWAEYSYEPVTRNDDKKVRIHWNNPYVGGNDFDVETKLQWNRGNISGNRAYVTVNVSE